MIDNNAPEEMTQMILEMIRNRESMSNKDKIAFINWYTKTFVISAEKQVDADIASVESVNKDELMEMLNGLIPKETDV